MDDFFQELRGSLLVGQESVQELVLILGDGDQAGEGLLVPLGGGFVGGYPSERDRRVCRVIPKPTLGTPKNRWADTVSIGFSHQFTIAPYNPCSKNPDHQGRRIP